MRKKKSKKEPSSKFVPLSIFMLVASLSFIVSAQNCCAASDGERERLIQNGRGSREAVLINVGEEDLEMARHQREELFVCTPIPQNLLDIPSSDQAMQAMDTINICVECYQRATALAEAKAEDEPEQEYISQLENGINKLFERAKIKGLLNDDDRNNMAEKLIEKARAAGNSNGALQIYFNTAKDKIVELVAKNREFQNKEKRLIAGHKEHVLKLQNSIWKRNLALWISIPSLLAAGVGAVLLTHYYWR